GLYGAIPMENMRTTFDAGVGGSLKYEFRIGYIKFKSKPDFLNRLYFTLESGYETFNVVPKLQNAYVPSTYSYVPVKLGFKYYVVEGLYVEWQSGVVYYTQHGSGHG